MFQHIHEDFCFSGGAVVKKGVDVSSEINDCAGQRIFQDVIGRYIQGVGNCNHYIQSHLAFSMFNVVEVSP